MASEEYRERNLSQEQERLELVEAYLVQLRQTGEFAHPLADGAGRGLDVASDADEEAGEDDFPPEEEEDAVS